MDRSRIMVVSGDGCAKPNTTHYKKREEKAKHPPLV